MTTTPIVVYGAGGHGRETALLIQCMIDAGAPFDLRGFIDDRAELRNTIIGDLPVLGDASVLAESSGKFDVALGIGNPRARRSTVERIRPAIREFPTLIHPGVPQWDRVRIGEGVQVHAGSILTCDITVGSFAILNRHVDISHDCRLDAWTTLAPAVTLAGAVHVGEGADLGARATCIPGVHVGAWSIIGAGAVVTLDIPDHVTAVGVPARVLAKVS